MELCIDLFRIGYQHQIFDIMFMRLSKQRVSMVEKVRFMFGCAVLCREKESDVIVVVLDLILMYTYNLLFSYIA